MEKLPDVQVEDETDLDAENWPNFQFSISYTDTIKGVVLAKARTLEAARDLLMQSAPPDIKDFQIIDVQEISNEDMKLLMTPAVSPTEN